MTLRVLHLAGSAVSDFLADLSRLYAQDCLEATADPARYEFHVAYVTPDRQWRFPAGLSREAIASAAPMPLADAIRHLAALDPDVMVPQMFCLPGMTSYRALFDVLGVPYVGSPPGVMALGADKAHAKAVVAAAGVRVPPGEVLRRGDQPSLAPPVVVKPADGDNSLGVTLVRDRGGYARRPRRGLRPLRRGAGGVVRRAGPGSPVRHRRPGRRARLPAAGGVQRQPGRQAHPGATPTRSAGTTAGTSTWSPRTPPGPGSWIPAIPSPSRVWEAARRCHLALGCRDYSLFDFRIDPDGQPWFLEAGLYCSFARKSVISVMAAAAGIPVPELFQLAIRESTGRASLLSVSRRAWLSSPCA